jgi:hypothetical protein
MNAPRMNAKHSGLLSRLHILIKTPPLEEKSPFSKIPPYFKRHSLFFSNTIGFYQIPSGVYQ